MQVRSWERAFEREVVFFAGRKHIELHHFESEQVGHVVRITIVRRDVMCIHEASVAGADERAAILNVELQAVRLTLSQEVQ